MEDLFIKEMISGIRNARKFSRHIFLNQLVSEYSETISVLFRKHPKELESFRKIKVKIDTEEMFDKFEDYPILEVYSLNKNVFFGDEKLYRKICTEKGYNVVKVIDDNYIQNSFETLQKNFMAMNDFLKSKIFPKIASF